MNLLNYSYVNTLYRPYVVNLLPCLTKICRRPEEPVQETLAVAMAKICPVLMPFTNNTETKVTDVCLIITCTCIILEHYCIENTMLVGFRSLNKMFVVM